MRKILFDNVNLSLKNNICIPNDEFQIFSIITINKYNTIIVMISIILILLLTVIIKFIQLIKKKHIEYVEDYNKTVVTINHMV